ncbi:6-carboxytetrahydropterin synthase QueD [Thiohalophilus sp.]|uniref:6-carboxytetrahydropterin synthase QueD n=1 Tax=Thiohalophilus sp. TaxID=3028392 RepID=UPI002ACEC45F|nr:6-carboxytetrahydropterin synthase QueD [Thiohalophilus sp.]MDZ7663423.1 6-carboxytetrahydropterin synthase QueD [Thiohalophilus sp.]
MAPRYTMTIVTDFAAAHYLRDYEGVCNRLHGHNWKVEVHVQASALDRVGMGMDFKDIKDATRELLGGLDHYNLNDIAPFDRINPTAENIAAFFHSKLSESLNSDVVKVNAVTIWETDRACVTYTEDET